MPNLLDCPKTAVLLGFRAYFPSILDIKQTVSTWHEPLQTMSAVVLRFDGAFAFVGAYRGICPREICAAEITHMYTTMLSAGIVVMLLQFMEISERIIVVMIIMLLIG